MQRYMVLLYITNFSSFEHNYLLIHRPIDCIQPRPVYKGKDILFPRYKQEVGKFKHW